jgi:predicted transcriptional regulator
MTTPSHDDDHDDDERRPRSVVRPYMMTRGRTTSSLGAIALHAPVLALIGPEQVTRTATPEDRQIIELCQTPTSLAELSARVGAPVGVMRVLVGDLADAGMVQVREADDEAEHRDVRLLERLLDGIRAL